MADERIVYEQCDEYGRPMRVRVSWRDRAVLALLQATVRLMAVLAAAAPVLLFVGLLWAASMLRDCHG